MCPGQPSKFQDAKLGEFQDFQLTNAFMHPDSSTTPCQEQQTFHLNPDFRNRPCRQASSRKQLGGMRGVLRLSHSGAFHAPGGAYHDRPTAKTDGQTAPVAFQMPGNNLPVVEAGRQSHLPQNRGYANVHRFLRFVPELSNLKLELKSLAIWAAGFAGNAHELDQRSVGRQERNSSIVAGIEFCNHRILLYSVEFPKQDDNSVGMRTTAFAYLARTTMIPKGKEPWWLRFTQHILELTASRTASRTRPSQDGNGSSPSTDRAATWARPRASTRLSPPPPTFCFSHIPSFVCTTVGGGEADLGSQTTGR
ncbi:hypothetical protein HDK90DRAFT_336098 [Phyllosticta capitalensis]|uniref:Uncharacterized protein n=1 Tax=Phyllosticta capitalensis TaxID=121624 RepID=A0ABR1YJ82_9PEZI